MFTSGLSKTAKTPRSAKKPLVVTSTTPGSSSSPASTKLFKGSLFEPSSISKNLEALQKVEARHEQLLNAFRKYCNGDKAGAEDTLEPLMDSTLDEDIVAAGNTLLNARPVSDPRWAEDKNGNNTTSSLLILHQLEEKKQRFQLFTQFLHEFDLLGKLPVQSQQELIKQAEKLNGAIRLRLYQNSRSEQIQDQQEAQYLLLRAIEQCAKSRKVTWETYNFSAQDIFYCQVTLVDEILVYLQNIGAPKSPNHLIQVNEIFQAIVEPLSPPSLATSSLPGAIETQIFNTFQYIQENKSDLSDTDILKLIEQAYYLTDILLEAYRYEASQTHNPSSYYFTIRTKLIQLFEAEGRAISLAEKYKDFPELARLCRDDDLRLEHYMDKYSSDNFAAFVFQMYMELGQYRRLLSVPEKYDEPLAAFLNNYPHLAWVHDLRRKAFARSASTLHQLGSLETAFATRRKTLLSLSKLSLLADEGFAIRDDLRQAADPLSRLFYQNEQLLYLLKAQERLPGLDAAATPVLNPQQLIYAYLHKGVDQAPQPLAKSDISLDDVLQALDIWRNAGDLISDKKVLREIWESAFNVSPWISLALDWETHPELLDETTIESTIKSTIFFQACQSPHAQGLISLDLVKEVLRAYQQNRPAVATLPRLLESVFELVRRELE